MQTSQPSSYPFLLCLPFKILSPRLKVLKSLKSHLKHLLSHLLPLLSLKATSIQHEMKVFVSFVVGEEDPSFLDMARVVVILIHRAVRYATTFSHCPDRYAKVATLANITKSFSHYFLLDITIDWYTDIEVVAHMMSYSSQLDKVQSYNGNDCVIVGNGASLLITHIGTLSPSPNIKLLDVLVVPQLKKICYLLIIPYLLLSLIHRFSYIITIQERWWQPIIVKMVFIC